MTPAPPVPSPTTPTYPLPALSYNVDSLAPHLNPGMVRHHHGTFFAQVHRRLTEAAADGAARYPELLSSYVLHDVYFDTLSPAGRTGTGEPPDSLNAVLIEDFGGVETLRARVTAAAQNLNGAGWIIVGVHPLDPHLVLTATAGDAAPGMAGLVPILALDLWEHAYWPQYAGRRADYVGAWWPLVDWRRVEARLHAARR